MHARQNQANLHKRSISVRYDVNYRGSKCFPSASWFIFRTFLIKVICSVKNIFNVCTLLIFCFILFYYYWIQINMKYYLNITCTCETRVSRSLWQVSRVSSNIVLNLAIDIRWTRSVRLRGRVYRDYLQSASIAARVSVFVVSIVLHTCVSHLRA